MEARETLLSMLDRQYRSSGWVPVRRDEHDVLHAAGPGGVTWFGLAILPDDLESEHLADRIRALADRRMPGGERCVLDLLPAPECHDAVADLLDSLGLGTSKNISLYSMPASASAAA